MSSFLLPYPCRMHATPCMCVVVKLSVGSGIYAIADAVSLEAFSARTCRVYSSVQPKEMATLLCDLFLHLEDYPASALPHQPHHVPLRHYKAELTIHF